MTVFSLLSPLDWQCCTNGDHHLCLCAMYQHDKSGLVAVTSSDPKHRWIQPMIGHSVSTSTMFGGASGKAGCGELKLLPTCWESYWTHGCFMLSGALVMACLIVYTLKSAYLSFQTMMDVMVAHMLQTHWCVSCAKPESVQCTQAFQGFNDVNSSTKCWDVDLLASLGVGSYYQVLAVYYPSKVVLSFRSTN